MTNVVLPYNPTGLSTKSIEGVMSNFTAIQGVVNGNIDATNLTAALLNTFTGPMKLVPTSPITASQSINTGVFAVCAPASGTIAITLPNHSAGQVCAVANYGPGLVNVFGSNIFGPGEDVIATDTVRIYKQGSVVYLIDDGTNWWIISGGIDTGWIAPTAGSNITLTNCFARQIGNRVSYRGTITTTAIIGVSATILTLPAAIANPVASLYSPILPTTGGINVVLNTGNNVTTNSSIASGTTLDVSSIAYFTD